MCNATHSWCNATHALIYTFQKLIECVLVKYSLFSINIVWYYHLMIWASSPSYFFKGKSAKSWTSGSLNGAFYWKMYFFVGIYENHLKFSMKWFSMIERSVTLTFNLNWYVKSSAKWSSNVISYIAQKCNATHVLDVTRLTDWFGHY